MCSCYIIIMRALRYTDVQSLVRSLHYTDTNSIESFSFCKTCYDNKNINLIILNSSAEMVTCTERSKRNFL